MSRSLTIIEDELKKLELYSAEAAAITAWANAIGVYDDGGTDYGYFKNDDATPGGGAQTVTGGVILRAGVVTAQVAMAAAMTGLSVTGAVAIAAGVAAFWASGTVLPSIWWAAATVITPPPALAGLQAALLTTFALNISEEASKTVSMERIASNIHTACTGGSATFPGPVVEAIS